MKCIIQITVTLENIALYSNFWKHVTNEGMKDIFGYQTKFDAVALHFFKIYI